MVITTVFGSIGSDSSESTILLLYWGGICMVARLVVLSIRLQVFYICLLAQGVVWFTFIEEIIISTIFILFCVYASRYIRPVPALYTTYPSFYIGCGLCVVA